MSQFHFVMPTGSTALVGGPIADFASGGTKSDTVSMAKYKTAYFFFLWGNQTAGTCILTMTVIPCDVAGQTTKGSAIPFQYRRVHTTETNTDWAWLSSLVTTAGDEQMYILKVSAANLPTVSGVKYEYCYVNVAETTADAAVGGGFVMMADPRGDEATLDKVTS